jgi:diguanylate cyclase (GGDEF)-like protein
VTTAELIAREDFVRVNIEHELAMSIGIALDIRQVLNPFLSAAQRLLDLHSIHFFLQPQDDQPSSQLESAQTPVSSQPVTRRMPWAIGIPAQSPPRACEEIATALAASNGESLERYDGNTHYFAIRLPAVGCIVFASDSTTVPGRTRPHEHPYLSAVFARLTRSCLACIEHQRVLDEVSAHHAAQTTTAQQASHDALTELPNRKTLQRRLRQAVASAVRHGHFGAVFFIDVDRFKTVNDSLGHSAGDAVLVALSRRLQSAARDEDTLARVGGDEFILVAGNLGDDAKQATRAAQTLAVRLAADCRRPVDVHGTSVHISTSMGICIYPDPLGHAERDAQPNSAGKTKFDSKGACKSNSRDSVQCGQSGDIQRTEECDNEVGVASLDSYCESIIRFADTAMYRTKHRGRDGFEFFAPQMQAVADRRLALEQQLRFALQRNELAVYFQPLVTSFGAVIGAEALLRWHSAELGHIEPGEFIPVAEESGLILEIGAWVCQLVCELVRDICAADRYPQFSYISINVSPRQIKQADFVDKIRTCITQAGMPSGGLRLEITEHAAIDDIEDTISKMKALTQMGVLMALDDFGTGYSSLSHLHRLPISTIKLDRSFVTAIADHEENQAIVDATIAMANHLGIECIPEGVEFDGDVAFFRSRPVHIMQGFYFSEALPLEDFLRVLEQGSLGPIADLVQQLPIGWPKDKMNQ